MHIAKPKIVGLTGGLGSGKSQVRSMLETLKVPCIDVDVVARAIHQDASHPATKEIARIFPHAVDANSRLARGSLRTVFALDNAENTRLKTILKPYVLAQLRMWSAQQRAVYVVWESALIIEAEIPVDRILLIEADRSLRFNRVKTRNPDWSEAQIDQVLILQLEAGERSIHADDVMTNITTLKVLQQQVEIQHHQYLTLWT